MPRLPQRQETNRRARRRWLITPVPLLAALIMLVYLFWTLQTASAAVPATAIEAGRSSLSLTTAQPPNQATAPGNGFDGTMYRSQNDDVRHSWSVAWGDYDGDGDLDLAVGNGRYSELSRRYRQVNQIYRNNLPQSNTFTEFNLGNHGADSRTVAWGDYDGDGDLDLAVANYGQNNEIYENVEGQLLLDPANGAGWQSIDSPRSTSLAWGDYDGDGDLDLAVGNDGTPLQLFRNAAGTLRLRWESLPANNAQTRGVSWADWDGDGDLDLAVANYDGPDQVYENIDGRLRLDPANGDGWQTPDHAPIELSDEDMCELGSTVRQSDPDFEMRTQTLAWGDWDGDGDPDLATAGGNDAGQCGAFIKIYENEAGSLELDGDSGWQALDRTSQFKPFGIAWGDWDGDGDLDLVAGNNAGQGWGKENRVYENVGVALRFDPSRDIGWQSKTLPTLNSETTYGIAVGDADGDGDLDLAVANGGRVSGGQENFILRNGSSVASLTPTPWVSDEAWASSSTAWGDWDGDGDLDLAVGNRGQANQVYENEAGTLYFAPADGLGWQADLVTNDLTSSVAWADWDGDGDLDLAVGNDGGQDYVYENTGTTLSVTLPSETDTTAVIDPLGWVSAAISNTKSLAWGDWDRDGDLDLAVGTCASSDEGEVPQTAVVYENDGNTLLLDQTPGIDRGWVSPEAHCVRSLGWGDWDNDSDLDLALATPDGVRIYENIAGGLVFTASRDRRAQKGWEDSSVDATSLAWGDVNGDGLLDLAVGTRRANRLYYNLGRSLVFDPNYSGALSSDLFNTTSLAWGDVDGDEDLDLVVSNAAEEGFQPNQIIENVGNGLAVEAAWNSIRPLGSAAAQQKSSAAAWGDVDGDGDLDLAFANTCGGESCSGGGWPNQLYYNNLQGGDFLVNGLPRLSIAEPNTTSSANFFATPQILASDVITLRYTLRDQRAIPVGRIEVFYSLDGGDNWQPAAPVTGTQTAVLATSPEGIVHEYGWDTFGSELFGRSDNVAVRIVAYDAPLPGTEIISDTYRYYNGVAGSFQRPFVTATSFPFRVQGTQVQVVDQDGAPVEGAWVYRLPQGQTSGAGLMPDPYQPLATDADGYLPGGGLIQQGDQLVALQPVDASELITFTDKVNLYYTSARPGETGLNTFLFNRSQAGEIVLQTSPDNPLLLFDVAFALEWDARNDEAFLAELESDIERASELLYDITDGQAALGRVHVLQAKELWPRADVIVMANNAMRPSAAIGGITQIPLSETVRTLTGTKLITTAYTDNQIRMGTVWDPFGEYTGDLGTDWWQALAHEFAHYLFFLPDNYLGFDDDALVKINCQESFMTSTFDPAYSEFLTADKWQDACLNSLAERTTGRYDWATVQNFYPMLRPPAAESELEGPSNLPLDVTKVYFVAPNDARPTLRARNFEVREVTSKERLRLPGAQAYLFQRQGTLEDPTDDVLIRLGTPTGGGDRLKVRGAYNGDRLCLFDHRGDTHYAGCEELSANDVSISLSRTSSDWKPKIQVNPVTSRTMQVTVTQQIADGSPLNVQIFPAHYWSKPGERGLSPTATLTTSAAQHVGTLELLLPAYDVAVRTWIEGDNGRESIDFFQLNPPWPAPATEVTQTVFAKGVSTILGPSSSGIGGPSSSGIGGPSSSGIGGPSSSGIGGPSSSGIGGPSSSGIGGPSSSGIGGPSSSGIGGPSSSGIGGPSSSGIGGPSSSGIGGPSSSGIGGPSSSGIGGAQSFNAPILSADAQVVVYSTQGFFEDNGVETLQIRSVVPELDTHPWLVPVGQAYQVTLDPEVQDERIIGLTYLQRDVPEGYEHTLAVYFLPDGETTWRRLATDPYVENLVVAKVQPVDGTYAVMSSVQMPALNPGRNLFTYPLSEPQAVGSALSSIAGQVSGVYTATLDSEVDRLADTFRFGRGYWVDISGTNVVTPYLAPPVRLPDGGLGFR